MALIEIHVHQHVDTAEIRGALAGIDSKVSALQSQGVRQMATLDDILNDEQQEATALGQVATAVQTLLANDAALKQQLADILAGALPPEVQAKVDAAFVASDGNVKAVQDILASLAPPAPPAP